MRCSARRGRACREGTRFRSFANRDQHLEEGHRLKALKDRSRAARRVTLLATLAGLTAVLGGCERWALDRQMEELCKKDGGLKVYETVTLPTSDFSNIGEPLARYQQSARSAEEYLGPEYKYIRNIEFLVGKDANALRGEGQLMRTYYAIYRRADGRLLGEAVEYHRGGGDGSFGFGAQPSGDRCPKTSIGLITSVFVREK